MEGDAIGGAVVFPKFERRWTLLEVKSDQVIILVRDRTLQALVGNSCVCHGY
jgi:hypothetical protein